ncbi:uncharacterized protein LOC135838548 [Planococcus citri]|uniref:uncharacterized protein LOC135838548 n=1 Tax=Planococcus citri TaxID=170843 RepID=UPI0031F95A23
MNGDNRLDRRKGSCTPQSADFSSNENTVLCEKIYPFAVVLRLRVLQIVCGISGIVMGTVAFIEEKSSMNLGIGMPAGLLTVTAAAGSIHTSRGFGGYVQPSCDPPWSHLRFLGPTITSAFSLTLLWSFACILHCVLLRNSFKALFTSEDLTILAVVLMSLTLITLFAAALVLRIDCVYDPD